MKNAKHDRTGARTAQDLEQKYKLGETNLAEQRASQQREMISRAEQAVAQFIASTTVDIDNLKKRVTDNESSITSTNKNLEGKADNSGWEKNKFLGTNEEGKIVEKDIAIDVLSAYPVGSIYMSVNSESPSTLFGGTWERFANGKVLVGVDENDTDFATVEKTGGNKTNTHSHATNFAYDGSAFFAMSTNNHHETAIEESVDRGYFQPASSEIGRTRRDNTWKTEINLLQPYITCYMWVRTA